MQAADFFSASWEACWQYTLLGLTQASGLAGGLTGIRRAHTTRTRTTSGSRAMPRAICSSAGPERSSMV